MIYLVKDTFLSRYILDKFMFHSNFAHFSDIEPYKYREKKYFI